jgi:hypothetical protein
MSYEIVDLILPGSIDKEKAKKELNKKYTALFMKDEEFIFLGDWLENNAREYISELEVIENSKPKYDREFWAKVIELNKENFNKIAIKLKFNIDGDDFVYFRDSWVCSSWKCSPCINFSEIDLINKQYKLLQEIYYSRLEGANE